MSAVPRFSVVIPVFNRAHSVLPTLESVRTQTFADFECIVVDDGSVDGEQLAEVVAGLADPRFRLVRQENGGASSARNRGVRDARGDYIAFLDSDDFFLPEKLARIAELAEFHPGAALYSRSLVDRGVGRHWVRPDRAIGPGEDMGEYLFVHNQFIPTPSLVVPRDVALAVPFDITLRNVEDPDLCFRIARAGVAFRMHPDALVVWNDTAGAGRLSHTTGDDAATRWLTGTGRQLTRRARFGYKATVLAYYRARRRPLTAFADLLGGLTIGRVPGRIILRQALRAYLPQGLYRQLVNRYVAVAGRGTDSRA